MHTILFRLNIVSYNCCVCCPLQRLPINHDHETVQVKKAMHHPSHFSRRPTAAVTHPAVVAVIATDGSVGRPPAVVQLTALSNSSRHLLLFASQESSTADTRILYSVVVLSLQLLLIIVGFVLYCHSKRSTKFV